MTLSSGTRLGAYEIVSPLGKGGMGEVYRANDTRLGREVAVKVLPENLTKDPDALKRFEREAKALAALSHPNILTIFDVGTQGGISYVVTELLRGATLRDHLHKERISTEKAIQIARPIAEGLSAAHSKGVIHRDLKPENIFVTSDGIVKLLDFGLARFRPPVSPDHLTMVSTIGGDETEAGRIFGTVPYMSPEQIRGESPDARSDLFAFGSIFYEMLAGKSPFQHDVQAETVAAILKDDPPSLPQLPPPLQRILIHCLEKSPDKRFQSARDLLFALQSADQDSAALKTSSPVVLRERRKIPIYAYVIVTALLVATGILWYQKKWIQPRPLEKSIAVLPFTNLSPTPEYEYFSDGITEDVVTHLSKIRNIKVISRTSTMQYKNSKKPLRQIAKELGVTTILEGSVRREGDRVRIVGQLIDAETDHHLWAETYDRQLKTFSKFKPMLPVTLRRLFRLSSPQQKRNKSEKDPQKICRRTITTCAGGSPIFRPIFNGLKKMSTSPFNSFKKRSN